MIVVYSGNRKVYPAIAASLYSLLEHNEVETAYLVIEDDTFPYWLPECAEIVNASEQDYFSKDGPNYTCQWSYFALIRAAYALMFPQHDRILSLDCDTLIKADISELWETNIETYRELRSRGPKPQSLYHGLIFAVKAWMQLGAYEECAREIAIAFETAEPTAYMLCQLGLCFEKLGKGAEAESAYRLAMQNPERPESLCLQFFGYSDYFPALRMTSICRREGRIAEARAWNTAARKACPQGHEWKLDAILLCGAEKSSST